MTFEGPNKNKDVKIEEDTPFDEYNVKFNKNKISSKDESFEEDRQINKDYPNDLDSIFDFRIIDADERIKYWESMTKRENYNGNPSKEIIDKVVERSKNTRERGLNKVRDFLKNIYIERPPMKLINLGRSYFGIIKESPILAKKFEKLIGLKYDSFYESLVEANNPTIMRFVDKCGYFFVKNPEKLTDNLLVLISSERKRIFEENKEYLEQNKEKFEKDYMERFEKFNKKHNLRKDVSQVGEYLKSTIISCIDPLVGRMDEKGGTYDRASHLISIDYQSSEDFIKHVYIHEASHAISGTTILKEVATVDTRVGEERESEDYDDYYPLRLGLKFTKPFDQLDGMYGRKQRTFKQSFKWLNEAVTEDMTVEMIENDRNIYKTERELFEYLVSNSNGALDKSDFYKAYLEDYNAEGEEKIPQWKYLFSKIQDAYDPTFIQRLDLIIKKKGAKKVLEFLKQNDWRDLNLKNIN